MIESLLIGAAVGGLGNLLNESAANKAQRKRLNKMRELLTASKYSSAKMDELTDRVGDAYNVGIMDELNKNAIGVGLSGALNPGNVRASIGSKLLGQRTQAMVDYRNKLENYNKDIDTKIAGLAMEEPDDVGFGDFVEGAVPGAMLGLQADELINLDSKSEVIDGKYDYKAAKKRWDRYNLLHNSSQISPFYQQS